jgi:HEAT repeat protein
LIADRREISVLDEVHGLLLDPEDAARDGALRCVKALGRPESAEPLFAAAEKEEDEYLKTEMAEALLELGDPRGFGPLIDVIADGEAAQARRDAWEHLRAHVPADTPLDPVAELRRWWKENAGRLVPDASGVFRPRP